MRSRAHGKMMTLRTEARALTVLDEPLSDDIRHQLVGVVDALAAHSWRIKGLSLPEAWSEE